MGSRLGVSTEKIRALNDYAKSPLFSDAEKVALEYADTITDTDRDVDDELFARVQRHYDDDTIAELTMIIAWENASSRSTGRSASHRKGSGSDDRSAARARPRPHQLLRRGLSLCLRRSFAKSIGYSRATLARPVIAAQAPRCCPLAGGEHAVLGLLPTHQCDRSVS